MPIPSRFQALALINTRRAQATVTDHRPHSARFGEATFSLEEAQRRLPREVHQAYRKTVASGQPLDPSLAPVVAHAMKEWAIDHGATHFSHWFQPMTGITAEKHDAFLTFEDGLVVERFHARELAQGEPDASSFPSGGLRNTFEARGYTAWDPATPAFLLTGPNDKTLCIPSVFLAYTGESLDEKTPLLRSAEALSRAAVRLLGLLGRRDVARVVATVGAEQEYFLVDRALYELRPDLVACGRTLFGAPPPKGQELEDQYFGAIRERVLALMADVEHQLVGLGIPVRTRHNEVAPAQYECAFLYEVANRTADHNQLVLETFRRTALRHDFAFLDHEKPFRGVNGSGKHNNWSLATEAGENLLEPGETPAQNLQFLLFLLAAVRGVHRHGGLLRATVASASNDHRLGANEAPPAIMSVFLGDDLTRLLEQLEGGKAALDERRRTLEAGVCTLPTVCRDNTDRNRTSPFAFTGNKFEFRALGSSANISLTNTALNAMMAESLDFLADRLEAELQGGRPAAEAVARALPELIREIRPILFNGDNYGAAWQAEAARRGLPNARTTPEALRHLVSAPSRALFERLGILSGRELDSRHAVRLENYTKRVHIEARVALEMARTGAIPAAVHQLERLATASARLGGQGLEAAARPVRALAERTAASLERIDQAAQALETLLPERGGHAANGEAQTAAEHAAQRVLPAMDRLREAVDGLEESCDDELWPYPKTRELLFHI
jgi:glutamine synthetase